MDKSIIIQTQVLFDKLKSLFVNPSLFAKSNIWCNMQNVNNFCVHQFETTPQYRSVIANEYCAVEEIQVL